MSAEDTARKVIAKVGLWWPAADEGKLDAAAAAWDAFASDLDIAAGEADGAARSVLEANTGPAIEAFSTFWAKYQGGGDAYFPATADAARGLAEACRKYAEAVRQAKHRVEELAVEIGATLVAGSALAIFTFGATEAAAGAISASLIASAEAVGVELSATVATIIGSAVAFGAAGAVEAAAVDIAVAQPIRVEGFHDGGYSSDEVLSSAELGGAGGAVLGGGGAGLRALSTTLRGGGGAPAIQEAMTGGGIIRPPRGAADAWERWAPARYDEIRTADDVPAVARGTGWSEQDIQTVKDHLFTNTHQLDSGVARFDADPRIAQAWGRMANGVPTESDQALLRHELFEANHESTLGTDYRTAHEAALAAGHVWDPPPG